LKAAVIGSAAVAAVVGAETAGLALTGKRLPIECIIGGAQSSGQDPCTACMTGTAGDSCPSPFDQLSCYKAPCTHPQFRVVPSSGATNPGSFNFWVTVAHVPDGQSVAITVTMPAGFVTQGAQPYFLYTYAADTAITCLRNTASQNCGNSTPPGATFIKNDSTPSGLFTPPVLRGRYVPRCATSDPS
jgi:hypothetical protein